MRNVVLDTRVDDTQAADLEVLPHTVPISTLSGNQTFGTVNFEQHIIETTKKFDMIMTALPSYSQFQTIY